MASALLGLFACGGGSNGGGGESSSADSAENADIAVESVDVAPELDAIDVAEQNINKGGITYESRTSSNGLTTLTMTGLNPTSVESNYKNLVTFHNLIDSFFSKYPESEWYMDNRKYLELKMCLTQRIINIYEKSISAEKTTSQLDCSQVAK